MLTDLLAPADLAPADVVAGSAAPAPASASPVERRALVGEAAMAGPGGQATEPALRVLISALSSLCPGEPGLVADVVHGVLDDSRRGSSRPVEHEAAERLERLLRARGAPSLPAPTPRPPKAHQ